MIHLRKLSLLLLFPLTLYACDDAPTEKETATLTSEYGTEIKLNVKALRDEGLSNKEIEKMAQSFIDSADSAAIKNEVLQNDKRLDVAYAKTLSKYIDIDKYEDEKMIEALLKLKEIDKENIYTQGFVHQYTAFRSQNPTKEETKTFINSYKENITKAGLMKNEFMQVYLKSVDKLDTTLTEKERTLLLEELEKLSNTVVEFNFAPYMTEGFYYSDFLAMKFEETNLSRGAGAMEFFLDIDVLKNEYNQIDKKTREQILSDVKDVIKNEQNFNYETNSFKTTNTVRMKSLSKMVNVIETNNYKVPETKKELKVLTEAYTDFSNASKDISEKITKLNNELVNGNSLE